MARLTSAQMQRLLDDTMTENEKLRSEVERLETELYRRRASERAARQSSLNPCEQVTLYTWGVIDKLKEMSVRDFRTKNDDFPAPIATMLAKKAAIYDLAELRAWKKQYDAGRAAHKAKMKQQRHLDYEFSQEFFGDEC